MLSSQISHLIMRMAQAGNPPLHRLTAQQARAFYERAGSVLAAPAPPMAVARTVHIGARDGAVLSAKLWVPNGAVNGVLLYFHGGGFTIGSSQTHAELCQQLAHLGGCAVVSLDYRLAPEHPFPTAVNDAFDALAWVQENHDQLAPDLLRNSASIAVGGDSAGGTLAAACALHARDHGQPLALQLLFYPGTGAYQDTPSHRRFSEGFVLTEADINYFFNHYIPDRALRTDWRFAPLLADDHSGVAPAWIGLAECDPLVDEGIAFGDALRAAGVAVDLDIYRGMVHGFINWDRAVPEAKQCHQDAGRALRNAFSRSAFATPTSR